MYTGVLGELVLLHKYWWYWYYWWYNCTTGGANIAGHVQTMVALTICPQMHSTWSIHDLHDDLGDDRIVIV